MHCPTCREENAPTTRFCTSCGAVLVEEAPGGGRRRVLRPWGMRGTAPPTVSPDFPEDAAGARVRGEAPAARRTDFVLAGAVVALLTVGTLLYPTMRSEAGPTADAPRGTVPADAGAANDAVVVLPAPTLMSEARLVAPPLVERQPAMASAATVARPKPAADIATRAAARAGARPAAAVPATLPARPVENAAPVPSESVAVVAAAPVVTAPPPVPPPVVRPPDRWQPLRDDLARCEPLGLWQKATCEQAARLAHCSGHWGQAALCPVARTEYGQ